MICCQKKKNDGNNRCTGKRLANKRASVVLVPGVFGCLTTGFFSGEKQSDFALMM